MKQKFIDFLRREGMLEIFESDFNNAPRVCRLSMDEYIEWQVNPVAWISSGFEWARTDTGREKYLALSEKWIGELESMAKGEN